MAAVRDQHSWETKVADDRLLKEVLHFGFGDAGYRFSFYPFYKFVDGYKQKFSLIRCLWERPQKVHAPLRKRPKDAD